MAGHDTTSGDSGDSADSAGVFQKACFGATLLHFCCPLTHLPGIPRACSKTLVLEQRSFTFAPVAESRLLCVGCEHWAYLSVETEDLCLVESQDICLVETQENSQICMARFLLFWVV